MYTQGLENNNSYCKSLITKEHKQSPAVGVVAVVVEQLYSQVVVVEGLRSQEGEPHKQGVFDTKGVALL